MPTTGVAAQPDLIRAPDGALLLSWIEPQAKGHALMFARYANSAWSSPREIARGADWFVNWADTPHLAVTADGALWAHWLRKSAAATYAYDVALVRSGDGGVTWSQPTLVNDDGTPTEHGFVSLWPAARDRLGIAWLDGRNSGGGHEGHEGHAATGSGPVPAAMTLRTAAFDASLQRHDEREFDAMTCDCCQTDAALTSRGPLLVYRDRTPEEIRDIAVTRFVDGAWTPAHLVHADHWKMPACPVNGPAVAARGDEAVVGWYTAAGDTPTLKLARSTDAGTGFTAPITLDQGAAVQGRIGTAIGDDAVWAVWTREEAQGQSLWFARLASDLSRELQRGEVARLQGQGRATGFAQLAVADDAAYVVWTDVVDGKPLLKGQRYSLAP
ncbi:hypothetical protein ACFOLC_07050 [Lysobacter cavernae]|uniref:Exo-alpha-sialidase n=1 Tax=Lysobacter cavernae TaxID=1685901 RepID=A0ABV7RS44_9GAMM